MSFELKPCPFCGGRAQLIEKSVQDPLGRPRVDCECCRIGVDYLPSASQCVAAWNRRVSPNVGQVVQVDAEPLGKVLGLAPAPMGAPGVAEILVVMRDGEAHTLETLSDALQDEYALELSGCELAASIVALSDAGHVIKTLGPFGIFGEPSRFKLIAEKEVEN